MNQPAALNLTGEWERIVNDAERHNARVRFEENLYRHKLNKNIRKVVTLALGAILSVILGATGLLAPWLAESTAVILVCIACFLGGRIWEGCRK